MEIDQGQRSEKNSLIDLPLVSNTNRLNRIELNWIEIDCDRLFMIIIDYRFTGETGGKLNYISQICPYLSSYSPSFSPTSVKWVELNSVWSSSANLLFFSDAWARRRRSDTRLHQRNLAKIEQERFLRLSRIKKQNTTFTQNQPFNKSSLQCAHFLIICQAKVNQTCSRNRDAWNKAAQ